MDRGAWRAVVHGGSKRIKHNLVTKQQQQHQQEQQQIVIFLVLVLLRMCSQVALFCLFKLSIMEPFEYIHKKKE